MDKKELNIPKCNCPSRLEYIDQYYGGHWGYECQGNCPVEECKAFQLHQDKYHRGEITRPINWRVIFYTICICLGALGIIFHITILQK